MRRMYKRTFRMYSIQNYQKEIEDLNAASALVYSEKPNSEGDPLAALQREVLYFRVLFSSL